MTVSLTGQTLKAVIAYHSTTGPGFVLQLGGEQTVISEEDADKLGRYLLFDKAAPELDVNTEGEDA